MTILLENENRGRINDSLVWCERGDSNPHGFTRQILSLVRLPVPPLSHDLHVFHYKSRSLFFGSGSWRLWMKSPHNAQVEPASFLGDGVPALRTLK
jgi:hypothetical protein